MEGGIWFFPGSERMNGSFNFKEVSISDDQVKILIPQVQLDFDQYQDIKNIWLGKNTLIIHQLIWNEENKTILKMEDINFNGYLEKKSGQLDGMRVLQIGQIYVDNNLIGPIYMQLSVNKLNLDAIVSMIQAYQEITQRGELYQSQLSQKLKMMVPNIINEGSQLKLDSLNIKTPEGVLQVSGEMAWNIEKAALPENISELMQSANAELHFRISKPLIEKWIQFVSTSTFFNQINPELQKADRKIRKDISIAMRQNANAILQMTREGAISEKDTLFLLLLQKKMVSLEEYNAATRQLLLEKSITLETSHMLIYWYSQVENSITILSNMAKESKKTIQSLMHAQITHMIDEGYIKLENNEYVMSLSQDEKGVKVNEKLVSSPDN